MSLKAESPKGYARPPPPSSFPPQMEDPRTFQSLPSMSSLLRHDQSEHEAQSSPFMARQFRAPYNMVKEPLWLATVDTNPPAQRASHPPQPQMNSHFVQEPSDSVLVARQSPPQHALTFPSNHKAAPQRRTEKRITQRKEKSQDQSQGRRGSGEFPIRFHEQERAVPGIEVKSSNTRRDSTPADSLPRAMPPQSQSSRSMPISGLLSDYPRYGHDLRSHKIPIVLMMSGSAPHPNTH